MASLSKPSVGYREITEDLIADIQKGIWNVGDQIQTEAELVDRFGTSRNTVRESLRELETLGFIKRRRGTRSILVSLDPNRPFVNSVQSLGELLEWTHRTKVQLLTSQVVVADEELARRLNVAVDTKWLRLEILRKAVRARTPMGFSEIYVPAIYSDIVSDVQNNSTIYSLLEKKFRVVIKRVAQTVEADAASTNVASRLNVDVGFPILLLRTDITSSSGQRVEIGFTHFPKGRYSFEMVLERNALGRMKQSPRKRKR